MIHHFMLFIIAVTLGVFGAFMGWSYGLVIAIIIVLTLINIGFFLYVAFQSQNIGLINYVIQRNKKEPAYAYILALKNEDVEEAKVQLNKSISRYKNTKHENSYAFILAILNDDFEAARDHAQTTQNEGFKKYNLALLDAYEGNGERHLDTEFSKPWMNAGIKMTHYTIQGNIELYQKYKEETLQLSKGFQLAANLYSIQYNENKYHFNLAEVDSTPTNIN